MKYRPLISVITVSFNAVKTIEQTILSVINQTYPNVEYIIIDGGSTDGTLDVIKKYQDKIAYWVSEPDRGIYDAMNKGIAKAKGDIIGIINADDWYELDAIESVVNHLNKSKDNSIYYGRLNMRQGNKILYASDVPQKLNGLKKGMVISHPTVFVSKNIYQKEGGFSTDYKIASDWDFILRMYLKGYVFIPIDRVIANFNIGGVSSGISIKTLEELHIIRKKNKVYKIIDFYYLYDMIKLSIFGKYTYAFSLWKNKIFYKK